MTHEGEPQDCHRPRFRSNTEPLQAHGWIVPCSHIKEGTGHMEEPFSGPEIMVRGRGLGSSQSWDRAVARVLPALLKVRLFCFSARTTEDMTHSHSPWCDYQKDSNSSGLGLPVGPGDIPEVSELRLGPVTRDLPQTRPESHLYCLLSLAACPG